MANNIFYICPECGNEDDILVRALVDLYQDRTGISAEFDANQITGDDRMLCGQCQNEDYASNFETIKE